MIPAFSTYTQAQMAMMYIITFAISFGLTLSLIFAKQTFFDSFGTRTFCTEDEERLAHNVRRLIHNVINILEGDKKKNKKNKKDTKEQTFQDLLQTCSMLLQQYFGNKASKKLTENQIERIMELKHVLNEEIEPFVQRREQADVLASLTNFVDQLKQQKFDFKQSISENEDVYFAVYLPSFMRDEFGSDHLTCAYSVDEKKNIISFLGQKVTLKKGTEIVYWTDENNKNYAYRPYQVVFADGTTITTHNSLHLPKQGTVYALNKKHQQQSIQEHVFEEVEQQSLLLTFPKRFSKYLCTFDFDGVLFKSTALTTNGKFDPQNLKDASLVCMDNLTDFGKFVIQLGIPFKLLTSRRRVPQIEAAISKLFSNCVIETSSWGKKIDAAPGPARDQAKADNKCSRVDRNLIHFDDEQIVMETIGFGSHVIEESNPQTYFCEALEGTHVTFALFGTVGTGKSTLAQQFAASIGAVSVLEDDGVSPLVIVAAADASDPDHEMLFHKQFHRHYHNRDTYFIFDTTGAGRKGLDIPIFQLEPQMDETTIAGCMSSVFNRLHHPNLNGFSEIDLDAPEQPRNPYDTNCMNLTEFINYLWLTRGQNQDLFEKVMVRLGQTCKFSEYGKMKVVHTTYREGMQNWTSVWGRQNRNCFHYLYEGKWYILKTGLEAGAEMKPDYSREEGDIYNRKLSQPQNQIRSNLFSGKSLPEGTTVSSKADGSLLQTTLVVKHVDFVYTNLLESTNEFFTNCMKKSYAAFDKKGFLIISTNGTLCAATHMHDYIVTAVGCDQGLVFEKNRPVLDAWNELLPSFIEKEKNFWDYGFEGNATHQMEAICPNRTTYTGLVHSELAVSYQHGGLFSLGVQCMGVYTPHFQMEDHLTDVKYQQPLFWRVCDSTKILEMLSGVQRISTDNDYGQEEFLKEFPPHNKVLSDNLSIDHEGFVLLVKTLALKQYDYGKLKTALYYITHKPHERHMGMLIEFAKNCDASWFPILQVIRTVESQFDDIDLSKLDDLLSTVYTNPQYGIPAPSEDMLQEFNNYQAEGISPPKNIRQVVSGYNAYLKLRDGDQKRFRGFIYGNNKKNKDFSLQIYKLVTSWFNLSHISDELSELISTKDLQVSQYNHKKRLEDSMSFMLNKSVNGFNEDVLDVKKHIMYLNINFPLV